MRVEEFTPKFVQRVERTPCYYPSSWTQCDANDMQLESNEKMVCLDADCKMIDGAAVQRLSISLLEEVRSLALRQFLLVKYIGKALAL